MDVVVVLQGVGAVSSQILEMLSEGNYAKDPYFDGASIPVRHHTGRHGVFAFARRFLVSVGV